MKTFVSLLVLLILCTVSTTALAANQTRKTPVSPAWMKTPSSPKLDWCQGNCRVYCASDDKEYSYGTPDANSCCYGYFACPADDNDSAIDWWPGYDCFDQATLCS